MGAVVELTDEEWGLVEHLFDHEDLLRWAVFMLASLALLAMAIHLAMIMRQHHTQFPGNGRTEIEAVGTPMWPGYALRSIGLFFATAAEILALWDTDLGARLRSMREAMAQKVLSS